MEDPSLTRKAARLFGEGTSVTVTQFSERGSWEVRMFVGQYTIAVRKPYRADASASFKALLRALETSRDAGEWAP